MTPQEEYRDRMARGMVNVAPHAFPIIDPLFKSGDRAVLRSGGPIMTVERLMGEDCSVDCVWFKDGEVKRDTFPQKLLRKASLMEKLWQ